MILNFMQSLTDHPRYRKAVKIPFIEANMSYIGADLIATWCRAMRFQPVMIESRDPTPRGRVGVWTGPYEKEAYAWTLRDAIENDTVHFAADLIGANVERDKATLEAQLRGFRMERQEPADPAFGKFKYAYTGKTSGGTKDDILLGLMIATYWGRRKREEQEFRAWCHERGYRLS